MTLPTPDTPVTLHHTATGRAIERDSFATIDREAGPHAYTAEQWPIVRRLIHSSGDFEFNGLSEFHPDAVDAGVTAVMRGQTAIVADVGMIVAGLSKTQA
ncbi:MAG TPA: precorrin-8X methylmutase, partial [Accumulibacter sp.]|nr:precorrin-8X methylmutase [Accumulibacter sp.]